MEKEREKEKDSLKKKNSKRIIYSRFRVYLAIFAFRGKTSQKLENRFTVIRSIGFSLIALSAETQEEGNIIFFLPPSLPPFSKTAVRHPSRREKGKENFPLGSIDCQQVFVDTNSISPSHHRLERALASSRADNEAIFGIKVGKAIHACIFKHSRTRPLSKLIRIENIIWI